MKLNTISRNAETYLVCQTKLITQMTQKLSFIIYFRKSSSTNLPPCLEVQIVIAVVLSQIELSQQGIREWLNNKWNKGLMPTHQWAEQVQLTPLWPILIWVAACLTRTTHML